MRQQDRQEYRLGSAARARIRRRMAEAAHDEKIGPHFEGLALSTSPTGSPCASTCIASATTLEQIFDQVVACLELDQLLVDHRKQMYLRCLFHEG
ncbi:hypothetical protein RJJ37_25360 [Rhizobium redzepovicii]|uniref:Uncharacterized protein n=1 Tax=Rhizobium redzepovicii TaxID=2867518 RepID=A0AAW8P781_9HYPH|nr:hypothetical protein [Rhizobium redzepovicii]MDR9762909.1 hypothetical protein [Rhizobium redzepovicii]MDR9780887.1 hypothetical protein [Rhizobium redzepovicii]